MPDAPTYTVAQLAKIRRAAAVVEAERHRQAIAAFADELRRRAAERRRIFSNPANYVQGGPFTESAIERLDEFVSWINELSPPAVSDSK